MNNVCSTELSHLWRLAHEALLFSFELSSYFMSVFYSRVRQHNITLSNIPATESCPSCGTLWIPGWTCSVRLQRSSSKRYWRQKKAIRVKQPPPQLNYWVQYQCKRCDRIVKFQHEKHIVSKEQNVNASSASFLDASNPSETQSKQNMNSRKRKKLRSKGLEGLLEKMAREEAAEKEKELSLYDFIL